MTASPTHTMTFRDHEDYSLSLTITDDLHPEALVLRLAGRLDTVTAKALEDHIAAELGRGRSNLVVHLAEVDYVSSYGLRVFLLNAKKLRGPGSSFALCGLTPSVNKIIEISGFDRILAIRATVEDALSAAKRAQA